MEAPEPPRLLDDGTPPATPDELLARLEALGIDQTTHRHAAAGAHTKNLFLRDKKGVMWLLVALFDRDIDVKAVARTLGVSGRLSFGSRERLMRYLGVLPGSVTPFAVINDSGGAVSVALDEGLRQQEVWNAHPLDNAMTTAVRGEDMLRFLEEEGHSPRWIEI
jgi:Ala-tRNA(Pro) deacylase